MKTICAWCHEVCEVTAYQVKTYAHNFCGMEHYGFHQRQKIRVNCLWCKKELLRVPSSVSRGNKVFCSMLHRDKWIVGQRVPDFWKRVIRADNPNSCWGWTGPLRGGYGLVGKISAHRFSFQLHRHIIPNGMSVLHSCDNKTCANPRHLRVGTQLDNMRDRSARGRAPCGENNNMTKLTPQQVLRIRELCKANVRHKKVAAMFNIYHSTVAKIARRETWKHLPEALTTG